MVAMNLELGAESSFQNEKFATHVQDKNYQE